MNDPAYACDPRRDAFRPHDHADEIAELWEQNLRARAEYRRGPGSDGTCEWCGGAYVVTSASGQPRRFCNDACRKNSHRRRRRAA